MENKRKLERFVLHVPARVSVARFGETQASFEVKTRDVSARGAYLYARGNNLPVGARIDIEFLLTIGKIKELFGADEQVSVRARGEVFREDREGVVVVFTNPFRFIPTATYTPQDEDSMSV